MKVGRGYGGCAKYCNEYVCLYVCLSVAVTQKPHGRLLSFVRVACGRARSSSDGVAIRYVLPVLWMASCFHTIELTDQNQALRDVGKFARWR